MTTSATAGNPSGTDGSPKEDGAWRRASRAFSVRNASALYVLVLFIVVFSIWVPETFLTSITLRSLLVEQTITSLVALSLVIPLAVGAFDISVGWMVGASGIFAAWLIGIQGFGVLPTLAMVALLGVAVGALNAFLVNVIGIDSFIATLGVGACLAAFISAISKDEQIVGLPYAFNRIAQHQVFSLAMPVYIVLAVATLMWYVLEQTPVGRRMYATGGNPDAARLAGVRTGRLVLAAFVVSAGVCALAGVLATARIGSGSPDFGPSYLLPAFAGVFLGSTQFRRGRYNVWGTLVAVYVLAVGVKGLQLAGAPLWLPDLFNGVALLLAVGLSVGQRNSSGRIKALLTRARRASKDDQIAGSNAEGGRSDFVEAANDEPRLVGLNIEDTAASSTSGRTNL